MQPGVAGERTTLRWRRRSNTSKRKPPACADQRTGSADAPRQHLSCLLHRPRRPPAPRQHPPRPLPRDTMPVLAPPAPAATPLHPLEAPEEQHGHGQRATKRLQRHIVTPAPTTERHRSPSTDGRGSTRLQAARLRGRCAAMRSRCRPKISHLRTSWYIRAGLDAPDRLLRASRNSRAESPGTQR